MIGNHSIQFGAKPVRFGERFKLADGDKASELLNSSLNFTQDASSATTGSAVGAGLGVGIPASALTVSSGASLASGGPHSVGGAVIVSLLKSLGLTSVANWMVAHNILGGATVAASGATTLTGGMGVADKTIFNSPNRIG